MSQTLIITVLPTMLLIMMSCANEPMVPHKQPQPINVRIKGEYTVQFDTAWVLPSGTYIKGVLDTNNDVAFRRCIRRLVHDSIDPYLVMLHCRGTVGDQVDLSVDDIKALLAYDLNSRESIVRMRTYLRVAGTDSLGEVKELDTEIEALSCDYWSFVSDSIVHAESTEPHYVIMVYTWKKSRELREIRPTFRSRLWGRGDSFMLKADKYVAGLKNIR